MDDLRLQQRAMLSSWTAIAILAIACFAMMLIERSGVRTTLQPTFKGDLKRETRWWAQYGQGACTVFVAVLLWQLDRVHTGAAVALIGCALIANWPGLFAEDLPPQATASVTSEQQP